MGYIKNNMSNFRHIKNDMSIFGHIKKHIEVYGREKEYRQGRKNSLGGIDFFKKNRKFHYETWSGRRDK